MINIAVIGCGVVAHFHLTAIAKLKTARAAAVCDIRSDVAEATAKKFCVARWTTSMGELLSDPSIDAVVLALPANLRTTVAIEAFRNGKHVLNEKPVAMNAGEVRAMIAAQGDLVGACCSSRFRSFESAAVAATLIRSGRLGKLRTINCRVAIKPDDAPQASPPVWRQRRDLNGGGIFVNWGSYDIDYLLGLLEFKLTPQFALARTWRVPEPFKAYAAPGSDAESHIAGLVTFAEGCILSYERAEFSSLPPTALWQIHGDRGALTLQMTKAKSANVVLTEPDPATGIRSSIVWEGDESNLPLEHDGIICDFVGAIIEKRPPRTSLKNSLLFARIADAFYTSADTGRPASFD